MNSKPTRIIHPHQQVTQRAFMRLSIGFIALPVLLPAPLGQAVSFEVFTILMLAGLGLVSCWKDAVPRNNQSPESTL